MHVICLEYHYVDVLDGPLVSVCLFMLSFIFTVQFHCYYHHQFSFSICYINLYPFCHCTVSLGFIKEVPATSCREIKASEGASAVNGNYWLDSIEPGKVTLVYCDMRTGGELL